MTPSIMDSRYSGTKRHPEGVRYNESWLYCAVIDFIYLMKILSTFS